MKFTDHHSLKYHKEKFHVQIINQSDESNGIDEFPTGIV